MGIPDLLMKYENNQIIRPLLQLVPFGIGSGIDSFLTVTLNKIRQERAMIFFDEIAKGNIDPNNDYLKTDDYVHKYILTMKYVLDTKREEKIVMFARLFKKTLDENEVIHNIDVFEDFIKMLNELSYREIVTLSIFESYDIVPKKDDENELVRVNKFWDKFEKRMENELGIKKSYVDNFMIRLARTGCYERFNGNYYGYTGGKGKLTSLYYELKKYIMDSADRQNIT